MPIKRHHDKMLSHEDWATTPRKRRLTKPTPGSQKRRLEGKVKRGLLKRERGKIDF